MQHALAHESTHDLEFHPLIAAEAIQRRVAELAQDITRDYHGSVPTVVGILKGSAFFMADLAMQLDLNVMCEFIGISSYGDESRSSGLVRITSDFKHPVEGLDVLVVEDIVDTGLTLSFLLDNIAVRRPRSVRVCSLLAKPARLVRPVPIDYLGFTIPDAFVVGYGLDYKGLFRNLSCIGVFSPRAQNARSVQ
jgi:hypoxanthine phosphoribosyltransferase